MWRIMTYTAVIFKNFSSLEIVCNYCLYVAALSIVMVFTL